MARFEIGGRDHRPSRTAKRVMRRTQEALTEVIQDEFVSASERGLDFSEAAGAITTALTGVMVNQIVSVAITSGGEPKELAKVLNRAIMRALNQIEKLPMVDGLKAARRLIEEASKNGGGVPTKEELERAVELGTVAASGGTVVIGSDDESAEFDPDALLNEIIHGPAPVAEVKVEEAGDGEA